MKIMFTMMSMQKGGAERVIANLSNYMINDNEIILVPTLKEKIQYKLNKQIKIRTINKKTKKRTKIQKLLDKISICKFYRLKKIIIEEKPDVIIAFLPEPSFNLLILKKLSKKVKQIPIIVSVRNDPVIEYKNKIINYIMKKLYPISEAMVFQTEDAKKYFDNIIKNKRTVIVNPVGDNFIKKRYEGEREKRIVAVGRLEPQKNYKLLIESFKAINEKHPDYILEIYGEGSLEEELKVLVKKMGLDSVVIFKGNSDNIEQDIYKAKVFIMTSDYEGIPNSLLEAFVLGVPCVSTDCPCGGPRYIIKNNENGILVPLNDSKAIVDAVNLIIERKDFENKLSENANKMKDQFTIEKIAKKWEEIILEIKEKAK